MAFPERRTANILLTILFFAAVGAAVYSARKVILLFVLAILFTYLIDPVVKFLQRHSLFFKNLRGPAVVEVYLAFVILIALLGYRFAPGLARNTVKLVDEVPVLLDGLATGEIATELGGKYGWSDEQEFRLKAFLARHKGVVQALVRGADRYLSNAAQVLGWMALIPILAIFFLRDGDHIADTLIRMFAPATSFQEIRAVADELHVMLTRYIRGQVILCGLSFVFYSATLLLLNFPHAIALGLLGGALEFIPVVGWTSTAAVVLTVGIVNHSHWIWLAALLGIWRVAQDYFLTPRVMGRQLQIHPLAAIFAVLVGAEIGGLVGIYLAVPFMAAMRVIWRVRTSAGPEAQRANAAAAIDVASRGASRFAEPQET
ncbi:MAG: AI-2E family transporter [Terriglobales bacterium]